MVVRGSPGWELGPQESLWSGWHCWSLACKEWADVAAGLLDVGSATCNMSRPHLSRRLEQLPVRRRMAQRPAKRLQHERNGD